MPLSRRDALLERGRANLDDSYAYLRARRDASGTHKNRVAEGTRLAIAGLEISIGAVGTGWLAGRLGTTGIGGSSMFPLGLTAGLAGLVASVYGISPAVDPHLANVSLGAIAGWWALWGAGAGNQAAQAAGGAAQPIQIQGAPGMPPPHQIGAGAPFSGQGVKPLSEAELAGIARRHG